MFLIMAATAAISTGKLADKRSMQDVNQAASVELINKEDLNQNQTALTAQKCQIIKEKVEKIFANLNIENLQGKSVQEQKKAALQILKYVLYNTTDVKSENNKQDQDKVNLAQFDYEINLIYKSLCEGKNITAASKSITLSFLYQMCGLDSQHITLEKDSYKLTKSGKQPMKLQHDIVAVNFDDGQRICDPSYTQTMQGPALRQNWEDAPFFSSQYYFEKINKGYQIAPEQNATALSVDLIKNTAADNDLSMER